MKLIIFTATALLLLPFSAPAGEKELIRLAETHMRCSDYYSSITELKRYQNCYPRGSLFPESMLLLGQAFYLNDNYSQSLESFTECHSKFPDTSAGEKALYLRGHSRLLSYSNLYALRDFQKYQFLYKDGLFREKVSLQACYAAALAGNPDMALQKIREYNSAYPEGTYKKNSALLQKQIEAERTRPNKSVWIATAGSAILPGFGHFYTGKYTTGILSLATNAVLITLTCCNYINGNMFQALFFGFVEFNFYQYSLYSAARNVHEYNSRDSYYKKIRMGLTHEF